jgi:hypothetical protein
LKVWLHLQVKDIVMDAGDLEALGYGLELDRIGPIHGG